MPTPYEILILDIDKYYIIMTEEDISSIYTGSVSVRDKEEKLTDICSSILPLPILMLRPSNRKHLTIKYFAQ